jgi:spore maturation protein CgeB
MKPIFLKDDVKNINDYLNYDYFFDGWIEGFKKLGHNVFVLWDESFYLSPQLKLNNLNKYNKLYSFIKNNIPEHERFLFSKKIANYCKKHQIDCIFTEINSFISPKIIKKYYPNITITQWYGVFPYMSNKDTINILNEYDIIWSPIIFDLDKIDLNNANIDKFKYIGSSVNQKKFYYEYDKNFAYDIVFIGGVGQEHLNRIKILELIAQKYDNFVFYGYGVENIPNNHILKQKYKGWADVNTIRKLYSSSKIVLNLTLNNYDKVIKGFNSRLFEISACNGAVQIVPNDKKILDFFIPNEEVVVFDNIEDLFYKIDDLLHNDKKRKKIANSAYKKSKLYTYDKRAEKMCNIIKNNIKI